MSKEIENGNLNIESNGIVATNSAEKRIGLVASVQKLGDLVEFIEGGENAPGALATEDALFANIPPLSFLADGSIKNARGGKLVKNSGLEARFASLSPKQIDQIQTQIDLFLNTVSVIGNLASARRLEPYLPVVLPSTQAGFKTLRKIAEQYTKAIPIPEGNSLGDIPATLKALTNLDEQLKATGLKDPAVIEALSASAKQQAEVRLEKSKIDGSKQVAQIRAELAEQKIYDLKRELVEEPGPRIFSRYQALVDQIIADATKLNNDELSVVRGVGIPKISDERSIYKFAGNKLRKQLEDEVTDDEIMPVLTKAFIKEILSSRAPEVIDTAITQLGVEREAVLKDPNKLEQLEGEIIARGLEFLIASSLEESNTEKALTITDAERKRLREASLALFREQELNRSASSSETRLLLDQSIETPNTASLGAISLRRDIKSTLGPFQIYPEYKTTYPPVVLQALGNLYAEYNQAFRRLVAANREYATDYQYCLTPDGTPINSFIQIDMVGLPTGFLEQATTLREEDISEALRGRIFEIENSIAMYSLLEYFFSDGTQDTLFKRQFRAGLDNIRRRYGRPIALLAVTDQKYQAMRETEFGKRDCEPLTDGEVREYSGFDKFFSPEEFKKYLEDNGGNSDYLLYVRSSDPVAKMKRPELLVREPLLADDEMRRIIKANALTFNIDNPNLPIGDSRRINDTKEYLGAMGMAFPVYYGEDLTSEEFGSYLRSQGVDPSRVRSGELLLRAKPMKGTYGGYGHFRGTLGDSRFRRELRNALLKRGSYIVQPELQNPTITNQDDGRSYMYIDRVFFSNDGQNYRFMGGERTLMPIDSNEAQNNRVHGNSSSVYAEII